jgi:hypothetical protein
MIRGMGDSVNDEGEREALFAFSAKASLVKERGDRPQAVEGSPSRVVYNTVTHCPSHLCYNRHRWEEVGLWRVY